jgi:hypothetical protein
MESWVLLAFTVSERSIDYPNLRVSSFAVHYLRLNGAYRTSK